MERVGFIGVGVMGKPMCLNLLKAGFPLTIFARRPDGVRAVIDAGAALAESVGAVAAASDIVITMLPDSPQVEEVVLGPGGVLEAAREGMAVVDMSTIAPATSRKVAVACAERGVAFLDAPVSGGSQGAEAGTLSIMIGGEAAVVERLRPLFAAMGSDEKIIHVGPAGAGEVVKLVNQHLCGVIAAGTLEAFVLGVKAGADVETMARVVGVSSGANWQLANPIRLRAFSGTFEPGFFTDLLVKDLRLILEMGEQEGVPVMLAAVAKQMYEAARAQGYGRDDYTAVVRPLEDLVGVTVRAKEVAGGAPAATAAIQGAQRATIPTQEAQPAPALPVHEAPGAGAAAPSYDEGAALQWLVRALGRHAQGRAELAALSDPSVPVSAGDLAGLARRAAALGLVVYQGPDADGRITVWLTTQGEQALGMLQRLDEV